jgi:hypothetical protein
MEPPLPPPGYYEPPELPEFPDDFPERCPTCNAILIDHHIDFMDDIIEVNGRDRHHTWTIFVAFCPTEDCPDSYTRYLANPFK